MPVIFLLFLFRLKRFDVAQAKPYLFFLIYGIVGGYGAGLVAYLLMPLVKDFNVDKLTIVFRAFPEGLVMLFAIPVLILSWLFGGLMGLIIALMITRDKKKTLIFIVVLAIMVVLDIYARDK